MLLLMCLALYLAADRPLVVVSDNRLSVRGLGRGERGRLVMAGEHVYELGTPGCACELLADGMTDDEWGAQQERLDAVEGYLRQATLSGPIGALVCWAGDEKKEADIVSVSVRGFRDLDFGRAWDVPCGSRSRARKCRF